VEELISKLKKPLIIVYFSGHAMYDQAISKTSIVLNEEEEE
jgi:hypothetical protein